VDEPVSLIDVAPTILQFLGIPAPAQFQGRSLLGLARGNAPAEQREVYSETNFPRHIGAAPLKSLRVGRYKYIDAPEPELYDLSRDPNELDNLYPRQKPLRWP
jgi:arylsulfatase A-like enzyme